MKYPVFFQALLLTITVFVVGLYLGVSLEENRMSKINAYYIDSEVSLIDLITTDSLIENTDISCDILESSNVDLLNKVYEEALILDEYQVSGRLTQNVKEFHKKYDVLRTYLWANSIKIKERCGENFNTVVYLYNNSVEDLSIRAEQNIWSKVLLEVKNENKDLVLIPIDINSNLISLNSMIKDYKIERYPTVIVNEEKVFSEIVDREELNKFL